MKRSKKGFTLVEMMIVLIIMGVLLSILIPTWNYFITQSKISTQNKNSRVIFNAAQTECTKQKFKIRNLQAEIDSLEKQLTTKQNQINDEITAYFNQFNTNYSSSNGAFLTALTDPTVKDAWDSDTLNEFNAWENIRRIEDTIANLPDQIADARSQLYLQNYDDTDDTLKDFYFYWDGSSGYSCDADLNSLNRDAAVDKAFADAILKGIETPEEVTFKLHVSNYNVVSVICAKNDNDRNIGSYPNERGERSDDNIVDFDFSDVED